MSSKQELMRLATWGPRALSTALVDVKAALIADGIDPIKQLKALNLVGWCLQADPSDRAQSCANMLEHPFFSEDEGVEEGGALVVGVEEVKGEAVESAEDEEMTEAQVLVLASCLNLTTPFHVAAELGGPLSIFERRTTNANELSSKRHCLEKTVSSLPVPF